MLFNSRIFLPHLGLVVWLGKTTSLIPFSDCWVFPCQWGHLQMSHRNIRPWKYTWAALAVNRGFRIFKRLSLPISPPFWELLISSFWFSILLQPFLPKLSAHLTCLATAGPVSNRRDIVIELNLLEFYQFSLSKLDLSISVYFIAYSTHMCLFSFD